VLWIFFSLERVPIGQDSFSLACDSYVAQVGVTIEKKASMKEIVD
jgi:hypothetical protein